ncbi:hypothetical protein [Terriglobus roseus]|uniref:Glycosyltransferase RgtA/B/C/D-like domain-containing protein n=1 Tax=Terriglobus roseus TaxID=392734 RepID=A0A1G7L9C0_9BACT|nr:hypothetical protein [Terriglobus roseus]SDF45894.1 hypothetical protein SAMN05444167_2471 [Terriglobus roseus]
MIKHWQTRSGGLRTVALALTAGVVILWAVMWRIAPQPLRFDDAWMFLRYSARVREGLGLSWNLDGIHTYGMTSLLWQLVVFVGSFLPMQPGHLLYTLSYLFSGVALVTVAFAVSRNARGPLRFTPYAFLFTALPLVDNSVFQFNSLNGMETMLAAALIAATAGLAVAQSRGLHGVKGSGWLTGVAAALAYLTRPESALPIVTMVILFTRWRNREQRISAFRALGTLFGIATVTAVCCKLYFGSYVPLSFYLKSQHAYQGYASRWYPVTMAFQFLQMFWPFLFAMVIFCRRSDRRMVVAMLGALAVIMSYLCTVTQIMGGSVRYFIPYFPLCVIPALLLTDERLHKGETFRSIFRTPQVAGAALIFILAIVTPRQVMDWLEWYAEPVLRYSAVQATTADGKTLPQLNYWVAIEGVAALADAMPMGGTLASSEVGQLGYMALNKNVIDVAGLNDTEIALDGFHPDQFLDRKADLIWLPHDDYTWQRGILITAPKFLKEYDFYPGAYIYGIAIRKDGPYHDVLSQQLAAAWPGLYPGTKPEQHQALTVSWDRQATIPKVH